MTTTDTDDADDAAQRIALAKRSLERQLTMVRRFEEGRTVAELAASLGVAPRTVRNWLEQLGLHRLRRPTARRS